MNLRAWAELLRLPALFTVPGDALAGAAATGLRPGRGTFLAIGSSLCLYEAGMALNDWADRDEDAVDRPHRPIPSGRVTPIAAFTAAVAFTAGGLALASRAGRPALATATALAGTVWAYDLGLKRTPAGPVAMAAARGLDLLLGATATATGAGTRANAIAHPFTAADSRATPTAAKTSPATSRSAETQASRPTSSSATHPASSVATHPARSKATLPSTARTALTARPSTALTTLTARPSATRTAKPGRTSSPRRTGPHRTGAHRPSPAAAARSALPAAATLAAHTLAVTTVSRHETQGGSTGAPLGALAATLALGHAVAYTSHPPAGRRTAAAAGPPGTNPGPGAGSGPRGISPGPRATAAVRASTTLALGTAYATTAARPYLHAALNPSPPLTQRAVGGGIRALIPLQAALAARSGALGTALFTAALAPLARRFARKVSVT
ncbi:UbiA family prenyltransferase [Streptomyces alboflavus]|uniref:UbiA family prenyltransferase n=1 Tax=Streptomyces alboflavus TaxID=67267 RepID=UPI0004C24D41|nr:UbiA family prenyltransferase [Streptomyces alboflavus]